MQKELNLFRSLFQELPNIAIFHMSKGVDFLNPVLEDIAKTLEGKVDYKEFTDENSAKKRIRAREYEYIILSDILSYCQDKNIVLKNMYQALENSANIIILEKKSNNNLDEIKELLDKTSFVAINDIDLFEGYYLITAKKLHMWGSGL